MSTAGALLLHIVLYLILQQVNYDKVRIEIMTNDDNLESTELLVYWSSAGRSFVMRSLNPCPENFDQIVVILGGGGGVNYQMQIVTKLPNGK